MTGRDEEVNMATRAVVPALISIEEYLGSSYEPDVEFVDGVLEEKNMGSGITVSCRRPSAPGSLRGVRSGGLRCWREYRTRTSVSRVRLPDLCLVRRGEPVERVRVTAPLLCLEILSPEDRPGRVMRRMDEFVAMGAENLWIVDPGDRSAATYGPEGMKPVRGTRLEIAGTAIYLDVAEMFGLLEAK